MRVLEVVDELYEAFVDTLHAPLAGAARRLACTLHLAPSPEVPWSAVFGHEVTLAAPALIAQALPDVSEAVVRDATLAHMLAVIEAFGTDRVEDGQIEATPELMALLGQTRRARDRALRRVCPGVADPSVDFAKADVATLAAIAAEHTLLRGRTPMSFDTYEAVSLGKQCVGFPASMALAFAAGWDETRRRTLHRLLGSVWLGLQMHDDVVDWEGDYARGGAWAASLAANHAADRGGMTLQEIDIRAHVHGARVLERMLERARRHFRGARCRSTALGATSLAAWAGAREERLFELVRSERASAGYVVRAHALAPWAGEVLS